MGRPPARAADEPDTASRILSAAEAAFAEHGFEGARLGDIAKAAGIRRPSLLYHFSTKHDLYCAVVEGTFEALGAAIAEPLERDDLALEARVEAMFRTFSDVLERRPDAARIVLREVLDGRGPGQDLLRNLAVPLLERVEAFLEREGRGKLRPGLPLRAALLSVVTARFVHAAASEPLAGALLGPLSSDGPSFLRVAFFADGA